MNIIPTKHIRSGPGRIVPIDEKEKYMKNLLVFDFGGTFVKYAMVDEEGNVSDWGKRAAPLESADAFGGLVSDVFSVYERRRRIDGLAISMPGIVNSDTGELYFAGAYTPVLAGKNIFRLLQGIPVKISIENDGKAAALAEHWKGTLQHVENGAVVVLGSAIAGGMIVNGRLCKGPHFMAGEFSLLTMQSDSYAPESTAGRLASTSALLSRVAAAKGMNPALFEIAGMRKNVELNSVRYTGKDIFNWIDQGDPVTCAVYHEWLRDIVHVLYNLKMIVDPERIAIGGGICANNRFLNDLKEEYVNTKTLASVQDQTLLNVELVKCRFGSDANLVGAACQWFMNEHSMERNKHENAHT